MADFNTNLLYSNKVTVGALNMPFVDTVAGALVKTDGAGNLTLSAGDTYVQGPASALADQVATYNGTTGKLIKASAASITVPGVATFTGLVNGALTYPSVDATSGYVLMTNGAGVLSLQDVSSAGESAAMAEVTALYNTNLSAGDHVKFTTIGYALGADITVDTTTTYTTTANVASLGRITVAGGKKWLCAVDIASFKFNLHNSTFTMQWFNADANTAIGSPIVVNGDGGANPDQCRAHLRAYFTPPSSPATVRIEVRITAATGLLSITRADFVVGSAQSS